jgi:hypothetical protein
MPRQTATPVTVSEVDIVGSTSQRLSTLPAGTRLLASRAVDGYQVDRFGLRHPWSLSPAAIGVRATALLGPAPPSPTVMIQPSSG